MPSIIRKAAEHSERIAIHDEGLSYTYSDLLEASRDLAYELLTGQDDLRGSCVAFMVDPGFGYVSVQWAIWRAGGICVPLCLTHPLPSLTYVLEDTRSDVLVVSPRFETLLADHARTNNLRLIVLGREHPTRVVALPEVAAERDAMILYTSGTTSKPKGVVLTHENLEAQITTLTDAWGWSAMDHIVNVLPLHHIHGIVNVVSCSLWNGATLTFLRQFSADRLFDIFLEGRVNVFMAVPTIYFKLIAHWNLLPADRQAAIHDALSAFRLLVCGSAALPVSVMEDWRRISGHTLLERYGMTEIGMAISNPLDGERRAGAVGLPLPGVSVRLVDEQGMELAPGEPGEIQVRGHNVFRCYHNRPEATEEAFAPGGWFRTGDMAVLEDGYYRIMGRTSVDIIKSGGYKISALEIEEVLREHPSIEDCAVVGLPDEEWGELVAAAIVSNADIDFTALTAWLRDRIPAYRVPRRYLRVEQLPRNAMGKVMKPEVRPLFDA
jgi:malonyl-CoA/methylmalonyl-CoA synthetase